MADHGGYEEQEEGGEDYANANNEEGAQDDNNEDDDGDFPPEWDAWMREHLNADLVKLRKAWVREVCAPELLVYEVDLVQDILEQLALVQGNIDTMREDGKMEDFTASLFQLDLERVRFSITKYIRTRLKKLERDALYLLHNQTEMEERCSTDEIKYAKEYVSLLDDHFKQTCTDHMPARVADWAADKGAVQGPNLDKFVVGVANTDIDGVNVDSEEDSSQRFDKGDLVVLRYRVIRDLVAAGSMDLL